MKITTAWARTLPNMVVKLLAAACLHYYIDSISQRWQAKLENCYEFGSKEFWFEKTTYRVLQQVSILNHQCASHL